MKPWFKWTNNSDMWKFVPFFSLYPMAYQQFVKKLPVLQPISWQGWGVIVLFIVIYIGHFVIFPPWQRPGPPILTCAVVLLGETAFFLLISYLMSDRK